MNTFLLAETTTRTVFEWGRIQSNSDWILPIAVAIGLMVLARLIYRRDAQELRPAVAWALTLLRTLAILALLLLYLQPQWRTEQERQITSRAVVLIDNSLSMGLRDDTTGSTTRAGQVAQSLQRSNLVDQLAKVHDVSVFQFGEQLEPIVARERIAQQTQDDNTTDKKPVPKAIDWQKTLVPVAVQTRLGEALDQLIGQQRDAPLSGIILITDGGQNAGVAPNTAIAAAKQANIPIFPIGVGSDRQSANVRVSDFVVPARAYPGDQYSVTGYLQAVGMAGKEATVELFAKSADDDAATQGDGDLIESQEVILGDDGEVLPVRFDLSPDEPGRRTLTLKLNAPATDRNRDDNRREADIEIVDHKNRVLLLAGGPMREYRFLRNLLHRDKSVTVDVLLQTAKTGASQEANRLLDDFPISRDEMYEYDCVVAIDPDWQALSDAQIDLLESRVAEQGGGLIVLAGAVNTGNSITGWTQDERMTKIRSLYPVTFHRRFATNTSSYTSSEPWPLDFTREGLQAEYLWLSDDQTASQAAWALFPGVFSFFPVDDVKPGASVLARFSDPQTGSPDNRPVYAAVQFYGSGRVLYLGSAELWRLRTVDETYFETIYTKMLRHVSQGRLLRGSSRGTLLVDRDRYMLGATIEVRAQLTDALFEPLVSQSVPMQIFSPSGEIRTIMLTADASRAGSFSGRFTVLEEGPWRLELPIPESEEDQRLTRRIQVKVPDLEREDPRRNDALLSQIATKTEGHYYPSLAAALPDNITKSVIGQLKDRTKTVIVTNAPSREWQQQWLRRFMYLICGLLLFEWFLRRLVKLA